MQNESLIGVAIAAYLLLSQTHSNSKTSSSSSPSSSPKYTRGVTSNQSVSFEVLGPGGEPVILPTKIVPIDTNATVLSVSFDALKSSHIDFETGSSGADTYITSIAGLSQQDVGPLSGWIYKVNNTFPPESPSAYKVNPGDLITWVYTTDLGKDVGAPSVIRESRVKKVSINNIHF